mmetsp:Transcript_3264/g.6705  ORF Transcript_3264/g.6705 Transcript_3264/m.6705 type:complete len:349 (-) Transcript_3264:76-1122(-)
MCTTSNIKLMFTAMSVSKAMLCVYLLVVGSTLVADVDYQRAYGTSIIACGVWIIIAGVMTPFSSCLGFLGSKLHNKFLLLSHAVCDTIIFAIQLTFGSAVVAYTASDHKVALRQMCSLNTPLKYEDECLDYVSSDRYAGLKLVWAAAYGLAQSDAEALGRIEAWEADNKCCGFGPPERCEVVEGKIPSEFSTEGVPSAYTATRVVCGDEDSWYPSGGQQAVYCGHFFDPTLAFPTVGGCRYEMPGTRCKDKDVDYDSLGCAAAVQATYDGDMQMKGYSVMLASTFELMAIVMACCFCWKRKAHDILPAYLEQVPYDPYSVQDSKKAASSKAGESAGGEESKSGAGSGH